MNIDTFYKVLSYACLYKAETGAADEILDTDITVSLIRERKPLKLLGQLKKKYQLKQEGIGIYRGQGLDSQVWHRPVYAVSRRTPRLSKRQGKSLWLADAV